MGTAEQTLRQNTVALTAQTGHRCDQRYLGTLKYLGVEEPAENLESIVLNMVFGAFKSREVWEAEWPADAPPLDDDRVLINNWAALVQRQGWLLPRLTVIGPTRAALMEMTPATVDETPAWLNARLRDEPITWRILMTALAQVATVHREAIERVAAEQMIDPEPIEEILGEAPVPGAAPEEDRSELMGGVIKALFAHTKALAAIAYDLEMTARGWPGEGSDEA